MSWLVGSSKFLGSDRNGMCDEYPQYAKNNPRCIEHPEVDWEWLCPCETSNWERDLTCGIPVRGLDFKVLEYPENSKPALRAFAEANRNDPDCRKKFAAFSREHGWGGH